MDRHQTVFVDNQQITPLLVQEAFRTAKNKNKSHQMLSQFFKMMNLYDIYQTDPSDSSIKYSIKNIVDTNFLNPNTIEEPTEPIDLSEVFPQNKIGNFGRVLYRKCRLTEKGIMQLSQDNQPPKLKEIKMFNNKIEVFGKVNNDNKIDWHEQQKKYPYRVVLIDNNDGHRAIYFSDLEKAQKIRLVLTQRYNYSGDFPTLMKELNKALTNRMVQAFKSKLVSRYKMIHKTNRFARNIHLAESAVNQTYFNRLNPILNPSNAQRIQAKSPLLYSNASNAEMYRVGQLLQTRSPIIQNLGPCFQNLNNEYINKLFKKWLQKAQQQISFANKNSVTPIKEDNFSRISSSRKVQILEKSKIETLYDKSSKIQSNISNKDNLSVTDHFQVGRFGTSTLKGKKSQFKGKESYIKQFERQQNQKLDELCLYTIQFLTLSSLFFKPIVTIQLVRNHKIEQNIVYNTIIKKKQPVLTYDLIKSNEEQALKLHGNLKEYDILVKVIDFLANEEVASDILSMKSKILLKKNTLLCDNKLVRLEIGLNNEYQKDIKPQKQAFIDYQNNELKIPPLPEGVKEKINQFWDKQSQSQGYYNQTNLTVYDILSHIEVSPLTWWKGKTEDQFQLLQVVYNASKIMGFKMIRSFPHLIKVFATIYPSKQEMTQKLLSFIMNFLKVYYYPQYLNRIQKFHKMLGLDQDCQFISKINFQILVIQKIVELQSPSLVEKLNCANIEFGYQMMEYIYQAFSRNFITQNLIQLWNFLYQDLQLLQLNMVLICVITIKYYEQDLIKAKRLKSFASIMQKKDIFKVSYIIKEIDLLKDKYFGEVKGLFDQIKQIFTTKPLQPVIYQFYKRQTQKMDHRKRMKLLQKKSALRKVNRQVDIQIPQYKSHHYTLHIYFTSLPDTAGNLTIKCGEIDYECLSPEQNRYFIIGEVSNGLILSFLDRNSTEYTCQLILNQGIHFHSSQMMSSRVSTAHSISYIAGLLTDSQIEIFKKGKKFDHFISPFIKQAEFREEMSRPMPEAYFLRKYDNNSSSREDLVKRIKLLFNCGSKSFNEIQFYIEHIETSDLTIQEKFYFVKLLAKQFSLEFCLCQNQIFEKHFLHLFLQSSGYNISPKQFECFYNDSLQYQFDAPKILKCRYHPFYQPDREIKLDKDAVNYFINKCTQFLYADIIVDDLILAVKETILTEMGGAFHQGELKLYYSSNGEVNLKSWQLKQKNKSKEIYYEEIKQGISQELQMRQIGQPQILMTQVLPSFAKISTILDYVNSNKHIDLKNKYQDRDRKKLPQNINILKDCQSKFSKIVLMRHMNYPKKLYLPFFHYYYELTHQFSIPPLKNIIFNNLKSDLKTLCLFNGLLKFGENAKIQQFTYQDDIGLYGNLRFMSRDSKGWYFFGSAKDQVENKKQTAKVFVNYGYGIFRWEPCEVIGYYRRNKQNKPSQTQSATGITKNEYLIIRRNKQKIVKEYELQIEPQRLERVKEILYQSQNSYKQEKNSFDGQEDSNLNSGLKYLTKFIK